MSHIILEDYALSFMQVILKIRRNYKVLCLVLLCQNLHET